MDNKVIQFLEENNIPYKRRADWANVNCPFCGDSKYHLGVSPSGGCTCFKCGKHGLIATIHGLLDCGITAAKRYARLYFAVGEYVADEVIAPRVQFSLPSSGNIMKHKPSYCYMRNRFPWLIKTEFQAMVEKYQITYTDTDYSDSLFAGRVIFPNLLNGKAVSYQARDYTKNSRCKYITASKASELVFHKDFLWGIDFVPYDKIMVCEGVMDALTIGAGAVHTHGVKWSRLQAEALCAYSDVYICYDQDEAGEQGARSLASAISHRTKVHIVKLSAHDINSCNVNEINDLKGLLQ